MLSQKIVQSALNSMKLLIFRNLKFGLKIWVLSSF